MSADEARACVNAIRGHWSEARALVLELHDRDGWLALGYDSWLACMRAEFHVARSTAYEKLKAARVERELLESPKFRTAYAGAAAADPFRDFYLATLAELPEADREQAALEMIADLGYGAQRRALAHVLERVKARRRPTLVPVIAPADPLPPELAVWRGDGARIPWPDEACRAIITSPPFALGVDYADGGDVADYETYRELMAFWAAEMLRVTSSRDGRLLIHVPLDRTLVSRQPVYSHWIGALEAAGWTYQTTIFSGDGTISRSTAWGSRPAPSVMLPMEAIAILYRGTWRQDGPRDLTPDELQRWGGPRGWWRDIVGEDDPEHPAVFDRRLVYRLLRIYTGPGDAVGDPFMGRGTVPVLGGLMGRRGLGCDRSPTYAHLAQRNLERRSLGGRAIDLAELQRSAMEVPLA